MSIYFKACALKPHQSSSMLKLCYLKAVSALFPAFQLAAIPKRWVTQAHIRVRARTSAAFVFGLFCIIYLRARATEPTSGASRVRVQVLG